MNDPQLDLKKFKFVIVCFLFFKVSGFKSCQEIKYLTKSKEQTTTIDDIVENKSKYGRTFGYKLLYRYRSNDKQISGFHSIGLSERSDYSIGQEVEIEYLEGTLANSRIKGSVEYLWVSIFILSIFAGIGFTAKLIVDTNNELKGNKKPR